MTKLSQSCGLMVLICINYLWLFQVLHLLSPRKGGLRGASILGAHVEGPFINKKKMGAHNAEYISELSNVSKLFYF